VRDQLDTPKSEKSERTIAIGRLAGELFEYRGRSGFQGDERARLLSPAHGRADGPQALCRHAQARAEEGQGRENDAALPRRAHTSITNAAAAGVSPAALMARAGHSNFKTTQGVIDLAGETFREEGELADERMFGAVGQTSGQT
jgi:hypothetical protein